MPHIQIIIDGQTRLDTDVRKVTITNHYPEGWGQGTPLADYECRCIVGPAAAMP